MALLRLLLPLLGTLSLLNHAAAELKDDPAQPKVTQVPRAYIVEFADSHVSAVSTLREPRSIV